MAEHEMNPPPAKRRCLSQLRPKHPIFLSHSGEEKVFVEQLCEDLKRMNQTPFFDQESDSLPKGERFGPYLFQAAEECWLAVVILSRGYMTSKWPMLELRAFVKSTKTNNINLKLFPVFYKLSPEDLSMEKVKTEWIEEWKKLVQEGQDETEDIALWSEGVRALRAFNGLDFKKMGTSEVKYRAALVEEICRNVPPMMKYKTDDVLGYQRICEITEKMFEEGMSAENEINICKPGCLYLGLYGMGGVGKTTLCTAMCSHFQTEFRGRVYHVELQGDAEILARRVERLKHAIRQLAGFDNRIVDLIATESQGLQCLQDRLRDQPPMFLVVDNVGDSLSSRDEARKLIKTVLKCGSKVMVTSRSREILESVLENAKYCKPIPRLKAGEAKELFLSVAAPRRSLSTLQPAEIEIVEACLRECLFRDDGTSSLEYLPLILRALGAYFYDEEKGDILSWRSYLPVLNNLQGSSYMVRVDNILGLNYSTLTDRQKEIFLDVAFLLSNHSLRRNCWKIPNELELSLIAPLHERTPFDRKREVTKREVKELQRKSLIYESGPALRMHDLYIAFARSLIEREGSKEWEWWVGHPPGKNAAKTLKRLLLHPGEFVAQICFAPKQFWKYEELVCLVLFRCRLSGGQSLDLGSLKKLRILTMSCCYNVEEIVCGCDDMRNDLSCSCVEGCMPELQSVYVWNNYHLKHIPFLKGCRNLKSLVLFSCGLNPSDFTRRGTSLFENLKALEALSLSHAFDLRHGWSMKAFYEMLECAENLKNLKVLEIFQPGLWAWEEAMGIAGELDLSRLARFPSLSVLSLRSLPVSIEELKGLDRLPQLRMLNLEGSKGFRKLPDLGLLPSLQRICVCQHCHIEASRALCTSFQEIRRDAAVYAYYHWQDHQVLEVMHSHFPSSHRNWKLKLKLPTCGCMCRRF